LNGFTGVMVAHRVESVNERASPPRRAVPLCPFTLSPTLSLGLAQRDRGQRTTRRKTEKLKWHGAVENWTKTGPKGENGAAQFGGVNKCKMLEARELRTG
jgi:hypothetical protein